MAKRPVHPMPADVRAALSKTGATTDYKARPQYQRNDYVGWITRARLPATRGKRIRQMIVELKKDGVYMGMKHTPSART